LTVTEAKLGDGSEGFRFVHPILYGTRRFGMIEVSISKAELQAAAATARNLMLGLGAMVLLVVGAISFIVAKLLVRPLRRLKQALRDAAMGDLNFRISHNRKDEFGDVFDAFNLFAAAVGDRLEAADRPSGGATARESTRVGAPPAARASAAAVAAPIRRRA
jgi:serine/threonine-protein kinase